ncbi:unnamed protein product [Parascedosporium putredinis]|uniref:ATP-dependent RNA helicase n=1 Tax=Parascedosporium putredinis TaxID=1442378 RepID=A0A9P1GZ78_9PEZI|nr:unnamed protein product [Parascedosporium putredinis]CAI7991530.1 unnamed protein product [Parascedosporium putredinis]
MADDGMILNFDLGDSPVKPRVVKVKGGRWRDRVQAQRSLKSGGGGEATGPAKGPNAIRQARRETAETNEAEHGEEGERPIKRVKVDGAAGNRPPHGKPSGGRGGGIGAGARKEVTSSLFSFNPTPVTKFDEIDKADENQAEAEPSNAPLAEDSFKALGLSDRLVSELGKLGLEKPTAIQKKTIPIMLDTANDAFLQAQTGSGKTLAYVLPMLHRVMALSQTSKIHRDSGIFGIVLTPTRELAKQTYTVMCQLLKSTPWLVASPVIGGESKKSEKARIRKGVNFLIATPGRLGDHLQNTKVLKLSTAEVAAQTYDGVSLEQLPDRRITVLCSATMKMSVQKLGDMSLKDAVHVEASREESSKDDVQETNFAAPAQLKQSYLVAPAKLRLVTLVSFLKFTFARKGSVMKAIVFISCADSVDFHYELLRAPEADANANANANANGSANASSDAGKNKARDAANLTANTVADAAYITSAANKRVVLHKLHDIPSVELVIELDPAFSVADHIHRIGRTARAGRSGKAVLFLLPGSEEGYVSLLTTGASTAPTAQLYDAVLQQGLSIPMELPFETHAKIADEQSYTAKAEALQLHFEQRLLDDRKRLELGRNGFKSHIRAYATHVKEERCYFDMGQLHLGHMAKSFCLREAPGGIGNGIDRKAGKGSARRGRDDNDGRRAGAGVKRGREGDDDPQHEVDINAGKDLFWRMGKMATRAGASEFNLG